MKLLIASGLLYLTGVALILFLRPQLMFDIEGNWKEFGIGRNPDTHTWMPIWLFCVMWAVMSFIIVVVLADLAVLPGTWVNHISVDSPVTRKRALSMTSNLNTVSNTLPDIKKGYYMLNTEGSGIEGVPKYIYLGPAAPV